MKAIKKPVVVDVFKYDGSNISDAFMWSVNLPNKDKKTKLIAKGFDLYVDTLEGEMLVSCGNYIICGVRGELYSCEPNIFKETYNLIEQDDPEDWMK